jgi:hypothetical protein
MARSQNRALSFVETYDRHGNVMVREKLTCPHCHSMFDRPGPGGDVGFCHLCFAPVCLSCGKSDVCDPFELKLERMERRSRLLEALTGPNR